VLGQHTPLLKIVLPPGERKGLDASDVYNMWPGCGSWTLRRCP